jgi:HPt (histidine-containing phosphotransfer) domain-containing protein
MSRKKNTQREEQVSRHPDQADESKAIHPEKLEKLKFALSKLGPKAFWEVITAYLRESKSRVAQMNQAVSQSNLPELHRAVHTLKSSSALMGAVHLSDLCAQLEAQVCETIEHGIDIPPNVYEMSSQIQSEYNRVEIVLETELKKEL